MSIKKSIANSDFRLMFIIKKFNSSRAISLSSLSVVCASLEGGFVFFQKSLNILLKLFRLKADSACFFFSKNRFFFSRIIRKSFSQNSFCSHKGKFDM